MAMIRSAAMTSASVSWRLRCAGAFEADGPAGHARVRMLMGWCSTTWVPAVVTRAGDATVPRA